MQVRGGASLPDALSRVPAPLRAGCQALGFHVMRWRGSAEAVRKALAPRAPPPPVDALLTSALALMWPLEAPPYPAHTLVDEAVKAADRLSPRSKGFVNAVLRQALREGAALQGMAQPTAEGRFNHPAWWVRRLQSDWPKHAEGILAAAQQHPPMTLRANARRGSLEALGLGLDAAAMAWRPLSLPQQASPERRSLPPLPQAAALTQAVPVERVPGFIQGDWSVQDAAAQLAAPLLLKGLQSCDRLRGSRARPRVLDACSAPGGKTAHLLEFLDCDLLALDADAQRLERVAETLQRLGLPGTGAGHVELRAADARRVQDWWDGRPFDAILLDAPCSASGIVRRHPDARWLRRESDIAALAQIQAELLDALWLLLNPGGCLLYATCSVFKAEGQGQIDAFLQRQGLPASAVDAGSPGHLLPLVDNEATPADPVAFSGQPACDGFFYALLYKPQHA
jgi:16S rRNA (cytosine967-C5)-methyltransferase